MSGWLIDTFLVTAALIALVLIIRRPVARAFGPGMAYALWALPLLRLLLPPLVLPAGSVPMELAVTAGTSDFVGPLPIAGTAAFSPPDMLFGLWLVGAAAFLIWRALGYAVMRRRLLENARLVGQVGTIRLIETPATPAPVAFGVRDRVIALPVGFMDGFDRTARDLAIAHELEHHAGRDLAVNIVVQPLLALHWFNPLAWIGWRALRRDQEAACDARVLAGRDDQTRAAYAGLIASFARGPRLGLTAPMACAIIHEKSIVHRLRSLTMNEPTPRRRLLGRALIGIGALALPLTASISYAANDAPPAPPAPSAAPHQESRITIIEHRGDDPADERKLHTRVITRDGKTIVIKTDQPMTDAQVEQQIAKALAEMPEPPVPPVDGAAPGDQTSTRQIVIMHRDGAGQSSSQVGARHAMAIATAVGGETCADGTKASKIDANEDNAGKHQIIMLRLCGHEGGKAQALEAIRTARASISANSDLSPEIRAKALQQLDAEIERLSKVG
jgi:bla regulator protein blaR1